jgi:GNAT superfamily N-acetyltransferase
MNSDDELMQSNDLLRATFDDAKYHDVAFLQWQYRDAPEGHVVDVNKNDEEGRLGHYAIVPQRYRRRGEHLNATLSLNTAVHERGRGQGLFVSLAAEAYEKAAAEGFAAVFGVANANSTPGFLRRLDFTLIMQLPPVLCVPTRLAPKGTALHRATADYLASDAFADLVATLDFGGDTGWVRDWTLETLRWRLSSPGATYFVVETPAAVAIATVTKAYGVNVAALLKLFARKGNARPSGAAIVAAACLKLHAPAAVYAGFNPKIPLRGVPIPKKLRPSPLNLITRSLDPAHPIDDLGIETFEFLDFDAY